MILSFMGGGYVYHPGTSHSRLTSQAPWCVCVLSVRVQSGVGVSSWAQWGKVRTTGRFSSMPDGPQLTTGLRTV